MKRDCQKVKPQANCSYQQETYLAPYTVRSTYCQKWAWPIQNICS